MNQTSEHDLQLGKWLGGAALGALAMYLLDPERGAPRRALSGEKLRRLGRQTGDLLDKVVHDVGQRATHALPAAASAPAISSDPVPTTAATAPTAPPQAQGERRASESTPLWHGDGDGMRRRPGPGPAMLVLGLAGAALLTRGVTQRAMRDGATRQLADDRFQVEKSIRIDAPPEQVYDLWTNYENFPKFMENVLEVHDLGDQRSHWVIRGPANTEYTFDSTLTEQARPHRLAWQSVPGSEIEQSGSVELKPSRGGTRAKVRLIWKPPAGRIGEAIATWMGSDPATSLEQDLIRMKDLVEGRPLAPMQRDKVQTAGGQSLGQSLGQSAGQSSSQTLQ